MRLSLTFKLLIHGRGVAAVKCRETRYRPSPDASIEPVPDTSAHVIGMILPESFRADHPALDQVRDALGVSRRELHDALLDAAGEAAHEMKRAA